MKKLFISALIILTFKVSVQAQNLQEKNSFGPRPNLKGDLTLSFGLNMLYNNDVDDLNLRTVGNNSFKIGYMYPVQIANSNFSFNAGFNFSFDKFAFDGDSTTLAVVSGTDELRNVRLQTIGEDLVGENGFVEKSKFEANYVNIPLEFRYYFNKNKVDNGGLFLAAGGSIGYLINGKTKIKYVENEQTKKIKQKENFELNQFRYGAHFRIGIAGFGAHFEYDFSELFNPGRGPLNNAEVPVATQTAPFRFGLSFNLF
ncbi:outer membrane beta-barrel protein [Marivirga harenae]|uniref:outer membrane beta-barrel protein n=1 Tax=Marivirga harenae TaxID=2010992 RepID=UPI0026DF718D|nr:outer membrane beta-barrel protein [Marivirga harenae]WKV10980.1 outer membrane beta-barrel protein [Marivirga harenae]|tara:strand:+ start:43245 stop:44015 length:771 start_codon:yes stop_codon:yes gene_type:complete